MNTVETIVTPMRLRWSETTITFDRDDHPDHVAHPRRYPLMVSTIVGTTRLSMVLMARGNGLNILYAKTLDKMKISLSSLCPSRAPFYGIIPRNKAMPLGRIRLHITFGETDNFRKTQLTFEMVDFHGT